MFLSYQTKRCQLPDGSVVVEEVGQMVRNQILARDPEINRIPELKLAPHFVQFLFGDAAFGRERRVLEKDVIPDFVSHLIWLDLKCVVAVVSAERLALQEVSNCVVRHVDGGIRQRFNQPLFVPEERKKISLSNGI